MSGNVWCRFQRSPLRNELRKWTVWLRLKRGVFNLQAGGRRFESPIAHQTATKLEKSLQKCRSFSRSYSKVTPIARIKSASGSTDKSYRLSRSFNCSLIERACSRSMLEYCFGSAMCCAQDSREKRGTEIFLPGRFDQGFMC